MADLGTAYVKISPSMSGFAASLKSGLTSAYSSTGSIASSAGATASSSFAAKFSAVSSLVSSAVNTAMGAVTSSISSAVSRVDTLTAFPRVMTNLGYSTEEADAAMEKLSEGIEGLPTSLDTIVGYTQSLVSTVGDLDTASDLAIAMNDAMTAFGASTSGASTAITQLNQMISSGTYDQQSWLSINNAAPGLLDTIAQAMLGEESSMSDLREALNDGTVSTEEFIAGLIELDQEGTDSLAAFSDTAATASAGIATSMQNVQTAITKNVANIIDAINGDGRINGALDKLKEAINAVGGKAVAGVEKIVSACETMAPSFKNAFTSAKDGAKELLKSNVYFVAFYSAAKMACANVKADFGSLGAVWDDSLSPIENMENVAEAAFDSVRDAATKMAAGLEPAMEELKKSVQAALDAMQVKCNFFAAKTQVIFGRIASKWSSDASLVDNVRAVFAACCDQMADAASSMRDKAAQAISDLCARFPALQSAADAAGGAFESVKAKVEEFAGIAEERLSGVMQAVGKVKEAFEILKGFLPSFDVSGVLTTIAGSAAFGKVSAFVSQNSKKIATFGKTVSTAFGKVKAIAVPIITILGTGLKTLVGSFSTSLATAGTATGGLGTAFTALRTGLSAVISPFAVIAGVVAAAAAAFIYLMSTDSEFAGTVTALVSQIGESLAPAIEVIAASFGSLASTVLPVVSSVIGQVVDVFGEVVIIVLQVIAAIAPLVTTLIATLAPIITSIIELVVANLPIIMELVLNVVTAIGNIVTTVLPIIQEAFSNVMTVVLGVVTTVWPVIQTIISTVMAIIQGVISAITSAINGDWDEAWETIKETFSNIWESIQKIAKGIVGKMKKVGKNIISGLIEGIQNKISDITETVSSAISSIPETAKSLLGIESPSKVFREIGEYTMLGMAEGIESGAKSAYSALDAAQGGLASRWDGEYAFAAAGYSNYERAGMAAGNTHNYIGSIEVLPDSKVYRLIGELYDEVERTKRMRRC